MVNNENLINLYELILSNNELTTKQLNECGFNSIDLKKLVDENKLKRIKRGIYEFIDEDGLFKYGQKLITKKQYDKAKYYFLRCLEINPNNIKISFRLFLINIRNENFEEAFKYFTIFYNKEDYNQNNNNLYLYLLSFIVDLPNNYKNWIDDMLFEDVAIKDEENDINRVRNLIINNKFLVALSILNKIIIQDSNHTSNYIIKKLLVKVVSLMQRTQNDIYILLETKDYQDIINLLEEKTNLSVMEMYILKLCYIYIEIEKNKTIPNKNLEYTADFFVAINRNNFELALNLNKEKIVEDDSTIKIIDIILKDIINKINEVSKDTIYFRLENQDLDNAFICLNQFLTKIDKLKYELLVINIIKLSILKQDKKFIKVKEILEKIENNQEINTIDYIDEFYISLSKNELDKANILIDIIKYLESNNLLLIDSLNRTLDLIKKSNIKNLTINSKINESLTKKETKLKLVNLPQQISKKTIEKSSENDELMDNRYYKFLYNVSKKIEKQKIVLVEDIDKIQNIEKYLKYFPNMKCFNIEHNSQIMIVLKYHREGYEDFKKLLREGSDAFKEKKYQRTIDCLELVNSLSSRNVAKCYSQLGWAYMLLHKEQQALKYFIVANYLYKIKDDKFEFSRAGKKMINVIGSLLSSSGKSEFYKPYFEMNIEELGNDLIDTYDIEPLQEIVNLINSKSLSIDEACLKFNLDEININIVKLIIARDCYIQGDYVIGDKLLKNIERSNNKNKTVIDLLNEIRTNKLFYKNRLEKQVLISNPKVLKY